MPKTSAGELEHNDTRRDRTIRVAGARFNNRSTATFLKSGHCLNFRNATPSGSNLTKAVALSRKRSLRQTEN
jgi:hypothetical protein